MSAVRQYPLLSNVLGNLFLANQIKFSCILSINHYWLPVFHHNCFITSKDSPDYPATAFSISLRCQQLFPDDLLSPCFFFPNCSKELFPRARHNVSSMFFVLLLSVIFEQPLGLLILATLFLTYLFGAKVKSISIWWKLIAQTY